MDMLQKNPFTTIKANDLNDIEINEQWVDIQGKGFLDLFCPTNQIAMFIKGGKGSGKTHLMRYYSSRAQMIRHKGKVLEGIKKDGYFGVYFQSSSLHGARFERLQCDEAKKTAIFIYAFDLWLAGLFLDSVITLKSEAEDLFENEAAFCSEVLKIFGRITEDAQKITTVNELKSYIDSITKEIDIAVNNSFFQNELDVEILTNNGDLVFGIPQLLAKQSSSLKDVTFLYLADELENITEQQQKYINSLIREKKLPVTFRIGVRRNGLKTSDTLGSGEANKEGHEFEVIRLDDVFADEKNYEAFAVELIINRLVAASMAPNDLLDNTHSEMFLQKRKEYLNGFFETPDLDRILSEPHIKKSEEVSVLISAFGSRISKAKGIKDKNYILYALSSSSNSILEKAAIHLFCQEWSRTKVDGNGLERLVDDVKKEIDKFNKGEPNKLLEKIKYYKNNYIASALRARFQNNLYQYLGLDNMLLLTKGFPRHIITLLRHIYRFEVFSGRIPFKSGEKVSIKSQILSLKESADWFHDDCVTEGDLGSQVSISLERLSEILRLEMYADKPVECSASSFTVQKSLLSPSAKKVLEWAEMIRVIIPAGQPRQDKNSQLVIEKYHINGLLCPRWGLSVSRRGAISFTSNIAEVIFTSSSINEFNSYKNEFENSRYAPFPLVSGDDEKSGQQGFRLE